MPLTQRSSVQALPKQGKRKAVESREESKRGTLSPAPRPVPRLPELPGARMREAIMAILAVLVGLAIAAIPLLPMLFCGAE